MNKFRSTEIYFSFLRRRKAHKNSRRTWQWEC